MDVIEFRSSEVVIAERDKMSIALFDGTSAPACVAILECRLDAARALREALGSALSSETSE